MGPSPHLAKLAHRRVAKLSVDRIVGQKTCFPSAACTSSGVQREGWTAPLSCSETSFGSDRSGPACRKLRNRRFALSSLIGGGCRSPKPIVSRAAARAHSVRLARRRSSGPPSLLADDCIRGKGEAVQRRSQARGRRRAGGLPMGGRACCGPPIRIRASGSAPLAGTAGICKGSCPQSRKAGPRTDRYDAMVAGDAASRASGDEQVRAHALVETAFVLARASGPRSRGWLCPRAVTRRGRSSVRITAPLHQLQQSGRPRRRCCSCACSRRDRG